MPSITSTLGIGSGIDTKALVRELAANAREARAAQISAKESTNSARLSSLAILKSGIEQIAVNFADNAAAITDTSTSADIKKLARDFLAEFNQLRSALTEVTKGGTSATTAGALSGDAAARSISYALGRLPQKALATTGTYQTLSDIGIGVDRYGALALDNARFDTAMTAQPVEVKNLLTGVAGLRLALRALDDQTTGPDAALTTETLRYERVATNIAKERARMEDDNLRLIERLTKSFSGMDQQVAKLNAVKSYIEQQVAAWNSK